MHLLTTQDIEISVRLVIMVRVTGNSDGFVVSGVVLAISRFYRSTVPSKLANAAQMEQQWAVVKNAP